MSEGCFRTRRTEKGDCRDDSRLFPYSLLLITYHRHVSLAQASDILFIAFFISDSEHA